MKNTLESSLGNNGTLFKTVEASAYLKHYTQMTSQTLLEFYTLLGSDAINSLAGIPFVMLLTISWPTLLKLILGLILFLLALI